MRAYLYINGFIGEREGEKECTSFTNLVAQFESQKKQGEVTEAYVKINSTGGYADVGEEMFNYLKDIPVKVITEQVGACCSAATFPFMAGEERIASNNPKDEFMIHAPMFLEVGGNSDKLKEESEKLAKYENEFAQFYAKNTGTDLAAIKQFMKSDTVMTPQELVDMGFATQIQEELEVAAVMMIREKKEKPNSNIMTELENKFVAWKKEILALVKPAKTLAEAQAAYSEESKILAYIDYTTDDGRLLSVNVEGEDPIGGQAVFMDEAGNLTPAEAGDYTLSDGAMLTVGENSEVTAYTPAESEATALEVKDKEIEALKAEVTNLKANASKELEEKIEAKITEVEGIVTEATKENEAVKEAEELKAEMSAMRTKLRIPSDRVFAKKQSQEPTAAERVSAVQGAIKKEPSIKEQIS